MEAKQKPLRPKLDRRNSSKNIDFDASASSSSSFDKSSSYRIIEGEFDRICRSLVLFRPEDFAIPPAGWEVSSELRNRRRSPIVVNLANRPDAEEQKLLTQCIDSNSTSTEALSPSPLSPETDYFSSVDVREGDVGNEEQGDNGNSDHNNMMALEWIFMITNFVLELMSTIFDVFISPCKPHYALISMLMSFTAVFICIIELIYTGRKERVSWSWKGKVTWFYYPNLSHKYFGTFTNTIGLLCGICQSIFTIVNLLLCYHGNNPINISIWPVIFAFGLMCSKFWKNPTTSSNLPRVEILEDGSSARPASTITTLQLRVPTAETTL